MTQPFPDNIFLNGAMAPSGIECDAPDLIIEGELPADLKGVYFRNGPDPIYPPREGDEYHWFHGDGMIQRFEFGEGKVAWKNRWVRTEKYELERAAGESLFGVLGNPMTADPSVAQEHYNTANTHVVFHDEKLLALMEGTIAVELKPDTLETVGNFSYGGKIDGPITAHPKFDHKSGEMIFFGNQAKGQFSDWVRFNVADKNGNLIKDEFIQVPYASFVHDFFVTEKYVVFPIYPLAFNLERAMEGGVPMAWEPDKGTHFGVMPRNGTADDVQWHTMDPRWSFHMVNAWDEDGAIKVDVCTSNATQFAPKLDGTMATEDEGLRPMLRRWTIDVSGKTNTVSEEELDDMPGEFPRTDDRYMTIKHRHVYMGGGDTGLDFNRLIHHDMQTGTRKVWGDKNYFLGEPILAPRSRTADEGDGYVLQLAHHHESALTEMLIFDAGDIEPGPICRAKLPVRIPAGFHGTWVGA
ncbi:MAG: carotenoid cleavage dioxygenase-like enzyme [Bacteroidia bacterium]|jgi:carotenoid cleavage dioxygenase-like enzyme